MDSVSLKAYAKINLTLGVLYKRADGYHALDTLMQSVSLHDTVTVEKASEVLVTAVGMTLPYQNTLRSAAERYMAYTGRGARIRVEKRIPAEAGMGGGSADAAAVLVAMDRLYGELDGGTLNDIALSVGADVPFCLKAAQQGGALCRAEGVGERLTVLNGMRLPLLIVKPTAGVSTRALFSALTLPRPEPKTLAAMTAIAQDDPLALGKCLFNALEEPAVSMVPEIGAIKRRMSELGALGAVMTGSGSAVFGVFESAESAERAKVAFADMPFSCVCHTL